MSEVASTSSKYFFSEVTATQIELGVPLKIQVKPP